MFDNSGNPIKPYINVAPKKLSQGAYYRYDYYMEELGFNGSEPYYEACNQVMTIIIEKKRQECVTRMNKKHK